MYKTYILDYSYFENNRIMPFCNLIMEGLS